MNVRAESADRNKISHQMAEIIRKEFDTALSLEGVAKRLHYNSNYLSGMFNKEMNMTFSEYLAECRLSAARLWLLETALPVKDIARRLQYNNPQNFIRSFRRAQGMTPGEYRMRYGYMTREEISHESNAIPSDACMGGRSR
ncbi:helix-turn-helix transcriptional regulator [Paenibacillus filicis]|uniref:Helix-turn-helix transcriptional regulator n=1 Tax=Paenibacillus gyeongsangnamensis TaxID=3388067 RepID=A0ABT4QAA6_9BACL|nr:helix-turn-helix transcriptional regulator [Paenibacillus filicis]MCZ8513812.1 helix-turn-helix transcriptional regulator [Paenibacillus filicis]